MASVSGVSGYDFLYEAAVGSLVGNVLAGNVYDGKLTGLTWLEQSAPKSLQHVQIRADSGTLSDLVLVKKVLASLDDYFDSGAIDANIPLALSGTPFQQRVWQALGLVPAGSVKSYKEIAKKLGSVPRAVGQACARNHIALFIPCHRIVKSDGGLGGFMGGNRSRQLEIKSWLLRHEGVIA